ncbi:heparan-alpha-glucosaminide N-acetyltransferase domain-containing protein [Thalassiella azotivora]
MAFDRLLAPTRLLGLDVARGLALLGMMGTHIVPPVLGGSVSWAYTVASGRASALFAVLAGASLVLSTRARRHRDGSSAGPDSTLLVPGARRGVLARAGIIAVIGLTLGMLESGVAVILVHYALLFAAGSLALGLPLRVLAPLAATWLVVSPVVAHALRDPLPAGPGPVTSWLTLADPAELVTTLLLTGYYPVLQWVGYLLVGMAVARLPLRRAATAAALLLGGLLLAAAAKVASSLLLDAAGGLDRLTVPADSVLAYQDLATALQTGAYGTTPTTTWWWLAVSGPHTGTPPDLLHTTGTSLAVVGGCLLLAAAGDRVRLGLLPLASAGAMTLTLYTAHVLALAVTRVVADPSAETATTGVWAVHAVTALAVGTLWQLTGHRGPLEALTAEASASARRAADERSPAPS